jgi:hypothetical protein
LATLLVVVACVLVIPPWLLRWELGVSADTLVAVDRAKAINDIRTTLLQAIGGAVLLLGAFFTYRQLQTGRDQLLTAQQGQVTERFTRATDQLGHAELDVRLGGIYALERIANDSPDDRATIVEVLTAYVRGHAPWPPRLAGQYRSDAPIEDVPALQVRAPNVHAALTVISRRQPPPTPSRGPDLRATDLRNAVLHNANLQKANLSGANLQSAGLSGANLLEALLARTNFQGAYLSDANLQRTLLYDANFQDAGLYNANLQEAHLHGANLQEAHLHGANLQGALITELQLPKMRLAAARLEGARADLRTIWPTGFDPGRAGVVANRLVETARDPES